MIFPYLGTVKWGGGCLFIRADNVTCYMYTCTCIFTVHCAIVCIPPPLFALCLGAEIADVLTKSIHSNTYGGNPMACTVGSAVLDVSLVGKCSFV